MPSTLSLFRQHHLPCTSSSTFQSWITFSSCALSYAMNFLVQFIIKINTYFFGVITLYPVLFGILVLNTF